MLFISTANLVSVLGLAFALTGHVLAFGPRTQCIEKIKVPDGGANCSSIAQGAGVNTSMIPALNPSIDCNAPLPAGGDVCTKQYTPPCTLNATAVNQTCGGLAGQYNISASDFYQYNDNVNTDCGNLTVGQTYCVSTDGCAGADKNSPICTSGNQ